MPLSTRQRADLVIARQKVALEADARRLGARYGLGEYTDGWRVPRLSVRMALGWVALVGLAYFGLARLASAHGHLTGRGAEAYLAAVTVALLAIVIPRRVRRTRLFLFEGGVVRESNPGPRPLLVVLPWADLETMSLSVKLGDSEGGDHVAACVLSGRTGPSLTLRRNAGHWALEAISAAAERVLAARHVGPLIRLLDSGQPVTVGSLTVDRLGISSQATDENGGHWHVPWPQARGVSTGLEGQRVMVDTAQGPRRAILDGQPNSFLARYVIEHAAERADVPLGTGQAPDVVAGKASDRALLYAEAAGLSQRYALGDCTNAWLETSFLVRVAAGWIIIGISLISLVTSLIPAEHQPGLWPLCLIALPFGALLAGIPPRSRRVRLYLFEGGAARAANTGLWPRQVALPWADLDKVMPTYDVDNDLVSCELRGRSGTRLVLGRHDGYAPPLAIMHAAQGVLASRSPGASGGGWPGAA
jgi:hypothetical protein